MSDEIQDDIDVSYFLCAVVWLAICIFVADWFWRAIL